MGYFDERANVSLFLGCYCASKEGIYFGWLVNKSGVLHAESAPDIWTSLPRDVRQRQEEADE